MQIGATQTLSAGSAAVTVSALAVGSRSITAHYNGDAHFTAGTSAALSQTVTAAATGVSLASNHAPAVNGQSVTITATVSPAAGSAVPTGTVQFYDGGVAVGSPVTLSSGTATLSQTFTVGNHTLTAAFTHDSGNFADSTTGSSLAQTVDQAGVTVAVSAPASSVHGQSVTLTATVAAAAPGVGTPTGTVTFYADGASLGTGTLNGSGVATLATAALTTTPHDITASYGGDGNFLTGASADHAADVSVDMASTTVTMGSASGTTYGATATFTATVAAVAPGAGTPTGFVTFIADGDQAHPLGTVTVDGSGVATVTSTVLAVGNHTVTASYAGDDDFLNSVAASGVSQTVTASNTLTSLSQLSTTSQYNTAAYLAATVTATGGGGGTPEGFVSFFEGPNLLGTGTLVNGTATFAAWGLSVGTHTVRAAYTGDQGNNYLTSASPTANHTVARGATTAGLTSSVNPSAVGQQVTFTAAVASSFGVYGTGVSAITGSFTFYDGGVSIGTATVDGNGHATLSTSALSVAGHSVTATYGGDARYLTATSAAVSQTVAQGTVTVGVSSSAATSVFGQSVTLTAAVNAALPAVGNPTGTVTFFADGVQVGSPATLSAGAGADQHDGPVRRCPRHHGHVRRRRQLRHQHQRQLRPDGEPRRGDGGRHQRPQPGRGRADRAVHGHRVGRRAGARGCPPARSRSWPTASPSPAAPPSPFPAGRPTSTRRPCRRPTTRSPSSTPATATSPGRRATRSLRASSRTRRRPR